MFSYSVNNLGMVRQWQKLFYGKRYSMTCLRSGAACRGKCGEVECPVYTPDFMKLADAYGAKGIHITKKEEIEPAFREAMKSTKTPYILEFDIDPEKLVSEDYQKKLAEAVTKGILQYLKDQ